MLLLGAASPPASSKKLVIAGTGDSLRLLGVLGRAFEGHYPAIATEVPPSVGSTGGIKRLFEGDCDLARVARPLDAQETRLGLGYRLFAYSPVVFVANLPSSCIEGVAAEQVIGIYSGALDSWDQLSPACEQQKIYVANREEGDSSRRVIEQRLPAFKAIPAFAGEVLYSTQEALRILERYPYTIGYLPLASALGSSLKILAFDGNLPQVTDGGAQNYPLLVPLGIVWKGQLQGPRRQFVEFLSSSEARELVRANGALPASGP
ncbi:PstS family phosphate ABC transporter substrate-binding protein [Desulfuromonas versatilis]|nr:substrate-binding domain-containing protein [Desulfuromonas versatilis]